MTPDAPLNKDALRAARDALLLLGEDVEQESDGHLHGFDELDIGLDATAAALAKLFSLPSVPGAATSTLDDVLAYLAAHGWVDREVVECARQLIASVRRIRYYSHSQRDILALDDARQHLRRHLSALLDRAEQRLTDA